MKSNKKPLKPESYKTILKEIKDNLNKYTHRCRELGKFSFIPIKN